MKKSLFLVIIIITVSLLMCSCGNKSANQNDNIDSDSVKENAKLIIGSWFAEVEGKSSSFVFNEDGTGLAINDEETEIPFTYTVVSDTSIDIVLDIGGEKVSQTTTYKLDGDTLTLDEVTFVRQ